MKKKKQLLALGLVGVASLALVACGDETTEEVLVTEKETVKETDTVKEKETTKETDTKEVTIEEQIEEVVQANLVASNNEDIDAYMETLYLSDEVAELTKEQTAMIFELADIHYEVEDIKILSSNETSATAEVTQVTTSKNGIFDFDGDGVVDFNDNRSVLTHTFILVDDKWKFETTSIKSTEAYTK